MPNTTIGVAEVVVKNVTTKYGSKPTYTLRGTDGKMYNLGFKNPGISVGDTVNLNYTEGKYGNDVTSATPAIGGTAAVAMTTTTTPVAREEKKSYSPPAKVFPIPPLHGDRAIVRQNSVTNACNILAKKFEVDGPFPMADADLAEKVITLARKFEAYSCGDLDMIEAMKEVK